MGSRRSSRPLTPEQKYLHQILGELRDMNAKLDGLAVAPARPADPASGQPEKVRLEEPVRPDSEPDEGIDVENDAPVSPIREQGTCQETTKRGNVCGKPLPCRYHG